MERKYNIDVLRIISALAVIGIHVVSSSVSNYSGNLDFRLTTTLHLIHNLLNWAVPIFFMITGYCVLSKREYSYQKSFEHVLKYVITLFTVGYFYAVLEEIAVNKIVNISVFLNSIKNVISGNLWDHMWYVYTIIGIYLVLPVIYQFMKQGKEESLILTGLLFLFTILIPTIEKWIVIGIDFPFGGYLFYVCVGGIIGKYDFKRSNKCWIVGLGVFSIIWVVINNTDSFGYCSLPICFIAVSIFIIVNEIHVNASKLILNISQCTWGIYLIHPFFINVAIKVLNMDLVSNMPCLKLMSFGIMICFLSLASTLMLRKIPVIKRIF